MYMFPSKSFIVAPFASFHATGSIYGATREGDSRLRERSIKFFVFGHRISSVIILGASEIDIFANPFSDNIFYTSFL